MGHKFKAFIKTSDALAVLALILLSIVFFSPYLFTQPTPLIFPQDSFDKNLGTDLPREIWPLARFIVDEIHATGRLPLWRPYLLGGAPLVGHPISAVFYPVNWIILILPLALALNLLVVLHIAWMAIGMFFYLRSSWGFSRRSAFAGAVFFAFSSKWVAHFSGGHWPLMEAVSWFPWILLAFEHCWQDYRLRWAVLIGVGLAVQIFTHGQIVFLSGVALVTATLARFRPRNWKGWLGSTARIAVPAVVLALGLSAVHWLPALELLPYTGRAGLSQADASFSSLPPVMLLTILFPPELKYPEWFLYPGAGVLILVICGWALKLWQGREWRWAVVCLAGIVLSLGSYTPLFGLLSNLPGFTIMRVPTRWWMFSLFALAILAARALEAAPLLNRGLPRRGWIPILFLVVIWSAGGAAGLLVGKTFPFDIYTSAIAGILIVVLFLFNAGEWKTWLVIGAASLEILWVGSSLIVPQSEQGLLSQADADQFLRPTQAANFRTFAPYEGIPEPVVIADQLKTVDGYDSFSIERYAELVRIASGCDFKQYTVGIPPMRASQEASDACPTLKPNLGLLDLLNVRYVILPAGQSFPQGKPVFKLDNLQYYELPAQMAAAFFSKQVISVPASSCLDRLAEIDPLQTALIEKTSAPSTGDSQGGAVQLSRQTADSAVFQASSPSGGLLVRPETWAPGWHARVDGSPAEVLRLDCALQGVWLSAGDHTVEFDYLPVGYAWGRWISSGLAIFLLLASLVTVIRR